MFSVLKANGEHEPFNETKVLTSIQRAGISPELQPEVLAHIKNHIYEGIPTAEIYQNILEYLGRSPHPYNRSKYSLKEAIMLLGPTGYPFEDFVAKILEALGYNTKVRQILAGKCISHEIDIIAQKDGKSAMIEAKFHNSVGTRSEVHVVLYTHARFEDVKTRTPLDEAWLVTNTKTTTDANTYAHCSGMKIISWSYPEQGSLRELIEKSKLHPITMLTTLPQTHKLKLLENHVVLCKQIHENSSLLDELPLSAEDKEKTLSEISFICKSE